MLLTDQWKRLCVPALLAALYQKIPLLDSTRFIFHFKLLYDSGQFWVDIAIEQRTCNLALESATPYLNYNWSRYGVNANRLPEYVEYALAKIYNRLQAVTERIVAAVRVCRPFRWVHLTDFSSFIMHCSNPLSSAPQPGVRRTRSWQCRRVKTGHRICGPSV